MRASNSQEHMCVHGKETRWTIAAKRARADVHDVGRAAQVRYPVCIVLTGIRV